VVTAIGSQVHGWSAGDTVAALLTGGGDAEQVCVPASQLHPLPGSMDLIDAAALPEAAATAWVSLLGTGGLPAGDAVLVPGASGGVGTFAIPVAAAGGARVLKETDGRGVELDLGSLLAKRASIIGTTLRSRPAAEKAAIVAGVIRNVWPLLEAGTIRPVIHARVPLADAERAHEMLRTGEAFGKVLLIP
jgi:NADPH:quinone reductase-like Zn-dependent oxidoreductase